MLTTNPQDSLFSCFIGHSSGINITTVINKKAVIWACTQINDWCFIQCLLCRVRRGGRHSLELHPRECFGQMWSCLAMSHSPGDGAETAPGWQAAPAQLGIAFPAELQGRWAATGKVGAEGAQRRALAHQLLLLDDGGGTEYCWKLLRSPKYLHSPPPLLLPGQQPVGTRRQSGGKAGGRSIWIRPWQSLPLAFPKPILMGGHQPLAGQKEAAKGSKPRALPAAELQG